MNNRIILGVDPGTHRAGYGLLKENGGVVSFLEYGCIESKSSKNGNDNLLFLYDSFLKIIDKWKPNVMAVERLFFFKNAKTITKVSEARGVIILAGLKHGLEITEFTPLQVKQAVSAYGKADKKAVQKMVKLILGLSENPEPDDAADALAVAICCSNTVIFKD